MWLLFKFTHYLKSVQDDNKRISDICVPCSLRSVDGKWFLLSEMSGAVEWLIIPYSEAAPVSDRGYDVGGTLRYSLDGDNITIYLCFPH